MRKREFRVWDRETDSLSTKNFMMDDDGDIYFDEPEGLTPAKEMFEDKLRYSAEKFIGYCGPKEDIPVFHGDTVLVEDPFCRKSDMNLQVEFNTELQKALFFNTSTIDAFEFGDIRLCVIQVTGHYKT